MDVKEIIELEKRIAPELFELIESRYNILLNILFHQPIGRRTLANKLNMGERIVRKETNKLQEENLIEILRQGMIVTKEGKLIIKRLQKLLYEIKGLSTLERKTKEALSIDHLIILPGNVEANPKELDLLGVAAANFIKSILKDHMIIGVTGGSSVLAVAEGMTPLRLSNISVIPARGGMGRDANKQANNIAAQLANKLNGSYELIHMPDDVEGEILQALKANPIIKQTLEKLKNLDVLIYGISKAEEIAERRGLLDEKRKVLLKSNAVAEAFGHYFDKDGNVIYRSSSVGIGIEEFKKIPYAIAVAGGANKAEAIKANCKIRKDLILITDESAANTIIKTNNFKEELI